MNKQEKKAARVARWAWLKEYCIGVVAGTLCAAYGVIALFIGRTFLPGLKGNSHTLKDRSGAALASAYLVGGLYLVLRFYVEKRWHAPASRANLYLLENVLLIGFVAALVYVLFHMGVAH